LLLTQSRNFWIHPHTFPKSSHYTVGHSVYMIINDNMFSRISNTPQTMTAFQHNKVMVN